MQCENQAPVILKRLLYRIPDFPALIECFLHIRSETIRAHPLRWYAILNHLRSTRLRAVQRHPRKRGRRNNFAVASVDRIKGFLATLVVCAVVLLTSQLQVERQVAQLQLSFIAGFDQVGKELLGFVRVFAVRRRRRTSPSR